MPKLSDLIVIQPTIAHLGCGSFHAGHDVGIEVATTYGEADERAHVGEESSRRRRRSALDGSIENAMHVPSVQLCKLDPTDDRDHIEFQSPLDLASAAE